MQPAEIVWNVIIEVTLAKCYTETRILLVETSSSMVMEYESPENIIQASIDHLDAWLLGKGHQYLVS